ncbi:uncharacterized protein CANTADRAFT_22666 [Suhomyces tanzawaensis NRRL Y-17324]|uniref:Uncharacterized protein n=1 Tax=Suhomyces tanzawaensis NRRL Y-17324 TaxID=984487 RepID=A0A1E4SGQ6_9ASCO|nr:uncharacterized protein CANTADRAFT_22666 [Suhomyces tanzawaensis NRRL Y-17324]ODV78699.1 hypothetical protein CANTADRAFT_22666 [Suhomyces tanzawaensis NRRL Y-17324]
MSSSSSSEDEEFSVISLLDSLGTLPARKKPKLVVPAPKPAVDSLPSSTSDTSEFDLQLPAIFQHDAMRNEQLHRMEKDLQRQIRDEETKTRNDYLQLMATKTQLVQELNDNGSLNTKIHTLERDQLLIEKLIKDSQQKSAWDDPNRHFYFFSTVHTIDLTCDFHFKINRAFFQELSKGKKSKLYHQLTGNLPQFVNYVLNNVTHFDELDQVNRFLEGQIKDILLPGVLHNSLKDHLKAIGANLDYLSPRKDKNGIPLKLSQFNNHTRLSLSKAAIVLNYHLSLKPGWSHYDQILEAFMLILCDFNANKHEFNHLILFIASVFPGIVFTFSKSIFTDSFAKHDFYFRFNLVMKYCVKPYTYGQGAPKTKNHEYELCFNILRLLNICFGSRRDDILEIVSHLSVWFLAPDESHLPLDSLSMDPSTVSLPTLFVKIKGNDIVAGFEKQNFDIINEFYWDCYRIELLRYVLLKPPKNNYKHGEINSKRYEAIRNSNVKRLATLTAQFNEIRNHFHAIIRDITFIDTKNIYDREEVAKRATNAYHTVNYMHNKFEKDLRMISKDVFYS